MISWEDFEKVELRVGTIVRVEDFVEARKPAYRLWVNLGEAIGIRSSSAQITRRYPKEALVGQQVVCVTNLPPKRVANFVSEVLVTGFTLANGEVVLTQPESRVPDGSRLE